jgi:hypothetical protein
MHYLGNRERLAIVSTDSPWINYKELSKDQKVTLTKKGTNKVI